MIWVDGWGYVDAMDLVKEIKFNDDLRICWENMLGRATLEERWREMKAKEEERRDELPRIKREKKGLI